MKLKPFNEAKALAGKPVVTRGGRKVTQLTKFEDLSDKYCLRGVVDGEIYAWDRSGSNNRMSVYDLFMAPEEVTMWVNVFSDSMGMNYSTGQGGSFFKTKEEGIKAISVNSIMPSSYIDTVPITFTI